MYGLVAVAAVAFADEPAPPETAPLAESTVEARIRSLLDATAAMEPPDRATYIQALLDADREPAEIQTALIRALAASNSGLDYSDTLALALSADGAAPQPEPPAPLDDAALERMRAYRLRHYSVRTETHVSGGGLEVANPYGTGAPILVPRPVTTLRTWAVYEGPERVTVPDYLRLAGEEERARDLDTRIRTKTWLSRAYYGLAGVGVAGVVIGAVGHAGTDDLSKQHDYAGIATAGLGGVVVGLIGGSLPLASATRLRTDYSRATDIHTAEEAVDRENEKLRAELGLTAEQAMQVEQQADVTMHSRSP